MSFSEWNARVELAACFRLVGRISSPSHPICHMSSLVPDGSGHVLTNPIGLSYAQITASDLCKVDQHGQIVLCRNGSLGIDLADYMMHIRIYASRPDVACVVHSQTAASVAISNSPDGLLPLTESARRFQGRIASCTVSAERFVDADYKGLADCLKDLDALFLRGRGILTCGRSIGEAYSYLYWLEVACHAQLELQSNTAPPPDPGLYNLDDKPGDIGRLNSLADYEWRAQVRLLERTDPSFAG